MKFKNFESSTKTKWIAKYVLYRRDSIYSNKMISFFRFIFVSWTALSCDPSCDRVKAQPLALLRAGASSAPSFFSVKPPPPRVGHTNVEQPPPPTPPLPVAMAAPPPPPTAKPTAAPSPHSTSDRSATIGNPEP
jgi:hypothetical protein